MREILFKGKRVDNGEWVEGCFFYWLKRGFRIPIIGEGVQNGSVMGFQVHPETVGQFTRLFDKNGKKIFEGDVDKYGGVVEFFTSLNWDGGGSFHPGFYCKYWFERDQELSYHSGFDNFEITGNIHDSLHDTPPH